eukprot:6585340-Prymnesium_polylepis.1
MRELGVGSRGRVSPSYLSSGRPPRAQVHSPRTERRRRPDEPNMEQPSDETQPVPPGAPPLT